MNPSLTLTYLRLGKIAPSDALCYMLAQFLGGLSGVLVARVVLGSAVANPAVRYAVTVPGPGGSVAAFAGELVISFGMMLMVLLVSNSALARFTGLFAGILVATYIGAEAPVSGMSMNPARTLGSASTPGSGRPSGSTSPPRRSACWRPPSCIAVCPALGGSSAPSCTTTTTSGVSSAVTIQ